MCGRFAISTPIKRLIEKYYLFDETTDILQFASNDNIMPSQAIPIIININGRRSVFPAKWGLAVKFKIAKVDEIGGLFDFIQTEEKYAEKLIINARAENLKTKKTLSGLYRKYRCVIPADGFYEWEKDQTDKKKYFFSMNNKSAFFMAGIYSREFQDFSAVIITTTPNSLLNKIHNRMPVILDEKDLDCWLNPDTEIKVTDTLLKPYPSEYMSASQVYF